MKTGSSLTTKYTSSVVSLPGALHPVSASDTMVASAASRHNFLLRRGSLVSTEEDVVIDRACRELVQQKMLK
jgi:hypothetical protein